MGAFTALLLSFISLSLFVAEAGVLSSGYYDNEQFTEYYDYDDLYNDNDDNMESYADLIDVLFPLHNPHKQTNK